MQVSWFPGGQTGQYLNIGQSIVDADNFRHICIRNSFDAGGGGNSQVDLFLDGLNVGHVPTGVTPNIIPQGNLFFALVRFSSSTQLTTTCSTRFTNFFFVLMYSSRVAISPLESLKLLSTATWMKCYSFKENLKMLKFC